jgi:hypothetical protein
MLEYSGAHLHGLREMSAREVLDAVRLITAEPRYPGVVEWLGLPVGSRGRAPDTDPGLPVARPRVATAIRRAVRARGTRAGTWLLAVGNAVPNHPDVAYEFVRTLKECGYRWVLFEQAALAQLGLRGRGPPHAGVRLPRRG